MDKERIKTIVLVFLVILSIFLTIKIFIEGNFDIGLSFNNKKIENVNYLISDILTPRRYIVNYSTDNHTIIYSDKSYLIWKNAKKIIESALNNKKFDFIEIDYQEFLDFNNQKSLVIEYGEALDGKIISDIYKIDKRNLIINGSVMKVKKIYINLSTDPVIIFSDGNKYIKSPQLNLEKEPLNKIVNDINEDKNYVTYYSRKEILGTEKEVLAPHNIKSIPFDIYVINKTDIKEEETIEDTVQRFFDKDINYIKRVIENKAKIYLYENNRMIINENGVIEYYSSIDETVTNREFYKSLKTALNFIVSKDSIPNDIYFISSKQIETDKDKGYKFIFGYRINEIPIYMNNIKDYSGNELEGPIEIEVYGDYIKSYKTYLRSVKNYKNIKQTEIKELQGPLNYIANNLPIIITKYINENDIDIKDIDYDIVKTNILKSIKDINFGYYDKATDRTEKLIPSWIVEIGNVRYIFDYENGKILNIEEIR